VSFKLKGTLCITKYLYQCYNQAPQGSTWRLCCDETPPYTKRGGFAARIKYIARLSHETKNNLQLLLTAYRMKRLDCSDPFRRKLSPLYPLSPPCNLYSQSIPFFKVHLISFFCLHDFFYCNLFSYTFLA